MNLDETYAVVALIVVLVMTFSFLAYAASILTRLGII